MRARDMNMRRCAAVALTACSLIAAADVRAAGGITSAVPEPASPDKLGFAAGARAAVAVDSAKVKKGAGVVVAELPRGTQVECVGVGKKMVAIVARKDRRTITGWVRPEDLALTAAAPAATNTPAASTNAPVATTNVVRAAGTAAPAK